MSAYSPYGMQRFRALLCVATLGLVSIASHAAPTTLDSTFGGNGLVGETITPGVFDSPAATTQQSDGKLVVAGGCYRPALDYQQFCVWRFQLDGSPDPQFGQAGVVRIDFPGLSLEQRASTVAVQPDGKILVAGVCNIGPPLAQPINQFCMARLLPSGALDTQGFATGGLWRARIMPGTVTSDEALRVLLLQPDGNIRLVGTCTTTTDVGGGFFSFQNFACHTRLAGSGQIDTSYVPEQLENGNVPQQFGEKAVLLADGTVVLAGTCATRQSGGGAFDYRGCVAQLSTTGSVVRSFGSNGFSVANQASGRSMTVTAVAVQGNGNVLVGGQCFTTFGGGNNLACVHRWSASGVADSAFPAANPPTLASYTFQLQSLAVQGDGKIVAGGDCPLISGLSTFICAARFHPNGARDADFNGGAEAVVIPISPRPDQFAALALQADGKIVLTGVCGAELSALGSSLCLARLQGGPIEFSACSGDVDGDGNITATDSVLLARVALGFTQSSVTQNIAFAVHAKRKSWPLIRDYLANHCGLRVGAG